MQGWMFVNDPGFWQPPQAKAILTSVPQVGVRLIYRNREYHMNIQYTFLWLTRFFEGHSFIEIIKITFKYSAGWTLLIARI